MIIADPILTPLLIGGAIFGGLAAGGAFSGKRGGRSNIPAIPPMKSVTAQPVKTATAKAQTSEQEDINRKRAQASLLTKDWSAPTLGKKGLLG